jgi:hypothetical protein
MVVCAIGTGVFVAVVVAIVLEDRCRDRDDERR